MTNEQRKNITPEEKAKILEERERTRRIASEAFIKNEDYFEFFAQNGYKLAGYNVSSRDWDRKGEFFFKFDEHKQSLNKALVFLGDEMERGDYRGHFFCYNIVDNPCVKYIVHSLTEFRVYSVVVNENAGGWGSDEPAYRVKFEKDLSYEWIKFLALKDEDYIKYILKECAKVQKEMPERIEYHKNMLAKRIEELQQITSECIEENNNKLNKYNQIEQIVRNVKGNTLNN